MTRTRVWLVIIVALMCAALFAPPFISGSISGNELRENVREYISTIRAKVQFRARESVEEKTTRVVFVGDIMLDRAVALEAATNGRESLFADVEHLFSEADAVVGNFEGTMTTNRSLTIPNTGLLKFTFDPLFADVLKRVGFTAFSLANNHSLDFGKDGYAETKNRLHEAGMLTFGSALNNDQLSTAINLPDMTLCLVGHHDLFTQNEQVVLKEIQTVRPACTQIVVFVHWGDEYKPLPNSRQRLLAHQYIDAGADIVIGAHPHVVQPIEIYRGKVIFYSLGNFVFDQEGRFETRHGLVVDAEWSEDSIRFTLIPVAIKKGHVTIASTEAREQVLGALIEKRLDPTITTSIGDRGEFVLLRE